MNMHYQALAEIDLDQLTRRSYTPSPAAWEDRVLYFLMLDRFSDDKECGYKNIAGTVVTEGETPPYHPSDSGNGIGSEEEAVRWREAGGKWVGGTLKGLQSKLGYLQRLGVNALWISPIFKQVHFHETYHGYGIQDFLEVDPHFGTRKDLKELVDAAHQLDILIILDIILNHAGDVFSYDTAAAMPPWNGNRYPVAGYNNAFGKPSLKFQRRDPENHDESWPNDGVWPAEFSAPVTFTQKGKINSWDHHPEYVEGDFENLKDIALGQGPTDYFEPSAALLDLCKVYQYWIAYADIDGYRIDTVKHMDDGATRLFASAIHEFAQTIGKENFYLIGEITGGRSRAIATMKTTGLDAALGIADIPDKLEYVPKGYCNPVEYFDLFRNSILVGEGSHTWFKSKVVTVLDDHDQVRKGDNKARFAARDGEFLIAALGLQMTTLGIPCIYYGTEQAFDGGGGNDRYIREAMFGGAFGAFRTIDRHFFVEENPVYVELAKILKVRKECIALRRGRQYLRQISGNGDDFGYPTGFGGEIRSVIPWGRIFNNQEIVCAINTNASLALTVWTYVDHGIHQEGERLHCLYGSGTERLDFVTVRKLENGAKVIELTVPPAGFVIYG